MPLGGRLLRKVRAAAQVGASIATELADTVAEVAALAVQEAHPPLPERAPRDWTTAGTGEGHLACEDESDCVTLSLLDTILWRRWKLLMHEISRLLREAQQPVIRVERVPAPKLHLKQFEDEEERVVVLLHQSALIKLMEMRARVGPIAFDASELGADIGSNIAENFDKDARTLALVYSKIEQFEGFGVTTYGENVRLQHAWYDVTGMMLLCADRIVNSEERAKYTDDAVTDFLGSIHKHVQETPFIEHDYNVVGPFNSAGQYMAWRSRCAEFTSCVVRSSSIPQCDIFAISYKHCVYEGLFRWSHEGDAQISGFIQERAKEGRSTYLWFDQLLKTQIIDRRDWVMAGLMPYRKFNTLRVCQVGARLFGAHNSLFNCDCSKSMWMDIEFCVAASTGRYFMLDGACTPNVDSNLNAAVVRTSLHAYIEVSMCDVKGANDGVLMPAMILFASAAHNYACRRVYSKSDVREAQEFACWSLLPETKGRKPYSVTSVELERIIHRALKVAFVTLTSNRAGGDVIRLTTMIESFPPVKGRKITPFSFLPGLEVRLSDRPSFPLKVKMFGNCENPGQYWALHVGNDGKLAYANLVCDEDRDANRVICRIVSAANPGVSLIKQTKSLLQLAGISENIDYDFQLRKSTRTW